MKLYKIFLFTLPASLFFGCTKEVNLTNNSQYLLLPAGRSFLANGQISVTVNSEIYNAGKLYDSCGGYWIKICKDSLSANSSIEIQYIRQKSEVYLFKEPKEDISLWLNDSYYIDCSNAAIKSKAAELTGGNDDNIVKALKIQQYIINNTEYRIYQDSFKEKASKTFELKYGSCMNFSRLFISLCRAAGIPSRSVWGIIYSHDDNGIYDYHHQWAEIMDNNGYWHPLDLNYTTNFNLSDIRYLDLLYSAEENPLLMNNSQWEIILGEVEFFDNYPAALTGKLGFELMEDKRPEYMTVKYLYKQL